MFDFRPMLFILCIIVPILIVFAGMIGLCKVVAEFFAERGWNMVLGFCVFMALAAIYLGVVAGFAMPLIQKYG